MIGVFTFDMRIEEPISVAFDLGAEIGLFQCLVFLFYCLCFRFFANVSGFVIVFYALCLCFMFCYSVLCLVLVFLVL